MRLRNIQIDRCFSEDQDQQNISIGQHVFGQPKLVLFCLRQFPLTACTFSFRWHVFFFSLSLSIYLVQSSLFSVYNFPSLSCGLFFFLLFGLLNSRPQRAYPPHACAPAMQCDCCCPQQTPSLLLHVFCYHASKVLSKQASLDRTSSV